MIEQYSREEILAIPTPEIARWITRIDRTNFALAQNPTMMRGGDTDMSDDGYVNYMVAKESMDTKDFRRHPEYEDVVLYELKPDIDRYKVMEEPYFADKDDALVDDVTKLSWRVGRTALQEGLARLGLYAPEESAPPIGAVAALDYRRADIRNDVDRELYGRKADIDEAVMTIESLTLARGMKYPRTDSSSGDEVMRQLPIYYVAATAPKSYNKLIADTESDMTPWWQELQRDLARIDEASGNL